MQTVHFFYKQGYRREEAAPFALFKTSDNNDDTARVD